MNLQELKDQYATFKNVRYNMLKAMKRWGNKIVKQAEKEGLPFDDIFEIWLELAEKEHTTWIVHVEVDGKDIWDLYCELYRGSPDRYRRVYIDSILEFLDDAVDSEKITREQEREYKKELMKQNIGSIMIDW